MSGTNRTYVVLTQEEKQILNEALSRDFGENRISQGAYISMLAEERLEAEV